MSTPTLKIKITPAPKLRGKMDVRFPANVEALSPIVLDKSGGTFTFSFDATGFATAGQGTKADTAVQSIVPGSNVSVDSSDPRNPIVSATGGGGSSGRELLTASRSYYVRTDGSDSNTGLSNTSGGAFASIAHALDVIRATIDPGGNFITINVADGTYSNLSEIQPQLGSIGAFVQVIGNTATPANCVLVFNTAASAKGFGLYRGDRLFKIDGFTIRGSGWVGHGTWTSGHYGGAIYAHSGSGCIVGANMRISKFYYGIAAIGSGSSVTCAAGVTVDESGDSGFFAFDNGHIECRSCTSTNAYDSNALGAVLGYGFLAEQGGNILCDGSTASNNQIGNFGASGGSMWAHSCTSTGSTYGFRSVQRGMLEASNSTSTSSGVGFACQLNSYMLADSTTSTSSTYDGFAASDESLIQGNTMTANTNGGYGFRSDRFSQITGSSHTGTGNTSGLTYTDFTAAGLALMDDADATAQRATLGLGTAATQNTGTSGANLPFLNGANTWASTQTFTSSPVFTNQSGSRTALGLGTAATQNTGTSGGNVPLMNAANTWSARQDVNITTSFGAPIGLTLTQNDGNPGPYLPFIRIRASESAFNGIGLMSFQANDSASNLTEYCQIVSRILSPTNGSEAGDFYFTTSVGGALTSQAFFGNGVAIGSPTSTYQGTGALAVEKFIATKAPVTKTSSFTVGDESTLICNGAGSITVTLPSASTYTGRWITIKTIAAQTVVSASSNVVPMTSGSAGTAILAATAGKWADLQSDGTNWVVMRGN